MSRNIIIDDDINFFIFKDIIKYINDTYSIYNNNGKIYLKNITFIFYKDLIAFIDMLSNIDIIGTLHVFKMDILNILNSSKTIKEKEKKITEYNNNIDIIKNNDIGINTILAEIKNNLQKFIKYDNNKCEKEIILLIKKHINYSKNKILCDKIKEEIKKNKDYSDFIYKIFNNIEFDNITFNSTIIDNISTTNLFSLKKNNNKILLLELFGDNDIDVIIDEKNINNIKNIENIEINIKKEEDNIFNKYVSIISNILIEKYDVDIINNKIYIYELGSKTNKIKGAGFINNAIGVSVDARLKTCDFNLKVILVKIIFTYFPYFMSFYNLLPFENIKNTATIFNNINRSIKKSIFNDYTKKIGMDLNISTLSNFGFIIMSGSIESNIKILFKSYINIICSEIIDYVYKKIINIFWGGEIVELIKYKYFIIKNFKKNISDKLFNILYIKNNIISLNEIKDYNENVNNNIPYTLIFNKLDCLYTTNLFRKKTINKNFDIIKNNNININNNNNNITNLTITPYIIEILKDTKINPYDQFGGYLNINITNDTSTTNKLIFNHSNQIINIIENILSKLHNNLNYNININKIIINDIINNINKLKKCEEALLIFSEKNINNDINTYINLLKDNNNIANKLNYYLIYLLAEINNII